MKCRKCKAQAEIPLPSHNTAFCRECFSAFFTGQVEKAIRRHHMIEPGERVLVALSGGKDSLSLMLELARLGHDVTGLHVDLGIPASSPAARAKVQGFCQRHGLDLRVVELEKEGLPIPDVKRYVNRPVCSACGKIKRHWFNRVALTEGFQVLATGHNLDDEVARLFANTLRWDASYLSDQGPCLPAENGFARKIKPLYPTAARPALPGTSAFGPTWSTPAPARKLPFTTGSLKMADRPSPGWSRRRACPWPPARAAVRPPARRSAACADLRSPWPSAAPPTRPCSPAGTPEARNGPKATLHSGPKRDQRLADADPARQRGHALP
jgi:hypothetical protein